MKHTDRIHNKPKVSICIPVYNNLPGLERALRCIQTQVYTDYEVIISDNASTEFGSAEVISMAHDDPRIRYSRQAENNGAAKNFAAAFGMARGQYIMWNAADDYITPLFVQKTVDILEEDPTLVAVTLHCSRNYEEVGNMDGFSGFLQEDPKDRLRAFFTALPDRNARFYSLYRRSALCSIDLTTLGKFAGDWAVFANVVRQGKTAVISDPDDGYVKARGGLSESPEFYRSFPCTTLFRRDLFAEVLEADSLKVYSEFRHKFRAYSSHVKRFIVWCKVSHFLSRFPKLYSIARLVKAGLRRDSAKT